MRPVRQPCCAESKGSNPNFMSFTSFLDSLQMYIKSKSLNKVGWNITLYYKTNEMVCVIQPGRSPALPGCSFLKCYGTVDFHTSDS